jgi:hypothetical protein
MLLLLLLLLLLLGAAWCCLVLLGAGTGSTPVCVVSCLSLHPHVHVFNEHCVVRTVWSGLRGQDCIRTAWSGLHQDCVVRTASAVWSGLCGQDCIRTVWSGLHQLCGQDCISCVVSTVWSGLHQLWLLYDHHAWGAPARPSGPACSQPASPSLHHAPLRRTLSCRTAPARSPATTCAR